MAWADGLQSLTSSRVNGNRGPGAPRTGNQYKLGVRRDEAKAGNMLGWLQGDKGWSDCVLWAVRSVLLCPSF